MKKYFIKFSLLFKKKTCKASNFKILLLINIDFLFSKIGQRSTLRNLHLLRARFTRRDSYPGPWPTIDRAALSLSPFLSLSFLDSLGALPSWKGYGDTWPVIGSVEIRQRCGIFVGLVRFGLVILHSFFPAHFRNYPLYTPLHVNFLHTMKYYNLFHDIISFQSNREVDL